MHYPTKESVQVVIDNLKKVLPLAIREDHLDMGTPLVSGDNYPCGTIHCHGGWYAIATLDTDGFLFYNDGALKMAQDLGFDNIVKLVDWATKCEKVWGNPHGTRMFVNKIAFESPTRPDGAKNLQDIITHWEEVRDRLKI